jgi:hypothetical protein
MPRRHENPGRGWLGTVRLYGGGRDVCSFVSKETALRTNLSAIVNPAAFAGVLSCHPVRLRPRFVHQTRPVQQFAERFIYARLLFGGTASDSTSSGRPPLIQPRSARSRVLDKRVSTVLIRTKPR